MQIKRLFIGIDFDGETKKEIISIIDQLQKEFYNLPIKWTNPNNLHLTLKFIGDFPISKMELLNAKISSSVKEIKPFELNFTKPGVFPSKNNPKIVWLGFENNKSLSYIVENLNNNLQKIGLQRENKKFSPHLTIGRIKKNLSIHNMEIINEKFLCNKLINFQNQLINEIILFESTLKPYGSIYTELTRYKLNS
jgi:2'-5' RNA ligase